LWLHVNVDFDVGGVVGGLDGIVGAVDGVGGGMMSARPIPCRCTNLSASGHISLDPVVPYTVRSLTWLRPMGAFTVASAQKAPGI
jgi:hypothetical protein